MRLWVTLVLGIITIGAIGSADAFVAEEVVTAVGNECPECIAASDDVVSNPVFHEVFSLPPPHSGLNIPGFMEESGNGNFQLVCLAPGYVDCSFAGAFAFGGCKDIIFVGSQCITVFGGIGGGLSSAAVNGGYATMSILSSYLSCTWSGLSGGCGKSAGGVSTSCGTVNARATGRTYTRLPVVTELRAPPASATAFKACPATFEYARNLDVVMASIISVQDTSAMASPAQIGQELRQSLSLQVDAAVQDAIGSLNPDMPASARLVLVQQMGDMRSAMLEQIQQLHVNEHFEIISSGASEAMRPSGAGWTILP